MTNKVARIVLWFIFCFSIPDVITYCIKGGWLNDKEYLPYVQSLLRSGRNIDRIIYNTDLPYISKGTASILTQYYVEGKGLIPRWTKMHEVIYKWIDSSDKADMYAVINKDNPSVVTKYTPDTSFYNPKYPYLTKERNVVFSMNLATGLPKMTVYWMIWCNGNIIENGSSEPLENKGIDKYKESIKIYASNRIKQYTDLLK